MIIIRDELIQRYIEFQILKYPACKIWPDQHVF